MKKKIGKIILLLVMITGLWAGCRRGDRTSLSDNEIIKQFNRVFYDSQVWERAKWMGIPTAQNPCDPWMMQEIIYEIKPDVIIETGTWYGGGALYYAVLLDQLQNSGTVITVDIENKCQQAAAFPVFQRHVRFIQGDSVSRDTLKKISRLVGKNKKVMVTLDSLHTKAHVLKELQLYSRFVSPGSYIIVQDTNLHGHPVRPDYPEGPMEALKEFLKNNDSFIIDASRTRYLLTSHPDGYLKRIK